MNLPQSSSISIIVLNWNQRELTVSCLNSLLQIDTSAVNVVVVDNASTDSSASYLSAQFPKITLLQSKHNLGYAGGNNVGIRYALECNADYILILNNDTIVDSTFLNIMVKQMDKNPRIAIAGPKTYITGTNKTIYSTSARFIKMLAQPFFVGFKKEDKGQFDKYFETDFVPGSCMLIRRDVFEKIGLFNEDFFLLFEDIEFCLRAKERGYDTAYIPNAIIWHQFSSSIGYQSPCHLYYLNRNRCFIARQINSTIVFFLIFLPYFILKKLVFESCQLLMTKRRACAQAIWKGLFDFLRNIKGKVNYFD